MSEDLQLNPLQRDLLRALAYEQTFIAVRAGWGSGKTSALVFAILQMSHARPGSSSLLITDTSPRYRTVLAPEIEKWLSPLGWQWNQLKGTWTDPQTQSVVWCRAYFRPGTRDSSHNPLEGINVSGAAFIDESQTMTEEVAQKALGRLRSGPSPILVMVGLPVSDAWWVRMAEDNGCPAIFHTSYANRANLSEAWFKATEALPPAEREAMIMNKPTPPTGSVYSEWSEENIVDGWTYREDMESRIAIDWGFRKPSVLILAHDPKLGADVICAEINPQEVTLDQLVGLILAVAWPRSHRASAPGPRIWLDAGAGDKAGAARNDQTALSSFKVLSKAPPHGVGLRLRQTTSPVRTDVVNGVHRVKRAIWRRQYRITREVWEAGRRCAGNSLRKALESYRWDTRKELPVKDGREDPLDALRYDCIIWRWGEEASFERRRKRGASRESRPRLAHRGGRQSKPWDQGALF
jgi:hypothetical protein